MEPRYTLTNYGWSCGDCGALVVHTSRHDKWHGDYENHGHPYAAAYGPGGEWDTTTGPVPGKDRSLT